MGAEVVDCAAAGLGKHFPGLGVGESGFVAVEVGFEFYDSAEGVGLEEGLEGEEVGVEAAVCSFDRVSENDWRQETL